jgi:hypothetical protein
MVALTGPRVATVQKVGPERVIPVAANAVIFEGGMVQINASGLGVRGTATVANVTIGVAQESIDNTGGAASALSVKVRRGIYRFANSASTDLIARTEIGKTVYVVDDQTVAKTDATGTRPAAGRCFDVDAQGVWVEFF